MNNIKSIRINLGMTIRELSKKSKVAVGYLSTLENDVSGTTNPSKKIMCNISSALGKTVQEVFFPLEKEGE